MGSCYDVLVVGSGIAGLYAALNLESGLRVLVVSKRELELSNTALAQGGIAAVLGSDDESELHFRDTLVAGANQNNPESVRILVREGPENIQNLIRLGVDFDRNETGELNLTLEGGHSRRRIAHHKDTTGYEVAVKLIEQAKTRSNIELLENAALLRLEHDDRGFYAAVEHEGGLRSVCATHCILATGGIGRVYKYTTNSKIATGDGIVFAGSLGAKIKNLSLIQFHPTAFAAGPTRERFLISESVRGEGAVLLNCRGERFMPGYDSRAELAPRDVVSRCILEESVRTGSENFYLDITAEDPRFVKNRFPAIYAKCLEEGVDITKNRIPVFPCQHYLMGGIDVDTFARSTVDGLYAVGECSHTGVHGNNRLASNSLLEALVFSRRAAQDISAKETGPKPRPASFRLRLGKERPSGLRSEIRSMVQESFFVNVNISAAQKNLSRIREISRELSAGGYAESVDLLETESLARIGEIILTEVAGK